MNKNLFPIIASVVFLFSIIVSCQKEIDTEYNYFLIPIDSVAVPDTVKTNKPFDITFFGLVGTNGCYGFSKFVVQKLDNEIKIEAWGKIKKGAQICPDVIVYLRGKKMNYSLSEPGEYRLKVKQDEGSYLQFPLVVEE